MYMITQFLHDVRKVERAPVGQWGQVVRLEGKGQTHTIHVTNMDPTTKSIEKRVAYKLLRELRAAVREVYGVE